MPRPLIVRDLALFLARVGIGAVFVAHGWQKLADVGIENVSAGFEQMDVPFPAASAWFAALTELVGGAALILGLATPLAGIVLAIDMAGAYLFVHAGNGMFVDQGGAELVLALGLSSLVFAAVGAGRLSVDHVITTRVQLPGASRSGSRGRATGRSATTARSRG